MWITHLTQAEKDFYSKQPTAKQMHEKMLRDGTYIAKGDKTAAAAFAARRESSTAAQQQAGVKGDVVEISAAGQSLKQGLGAQGISKETDAQLLGQARERKLRFTSAAALHEAVKNGYLELNGQQYFLSDEMKKSLAAKDKAMQKLRQGVAEANMLGQQAVEAQRQGEAMQKSAQKESRIMQTVSRIMHGRKVSPADEKELAEFAPELYSMAKSAGMLELHKRSRREEEEDNKISEQNDMDRDWEQSPSSIPDAVDAPLPAYNVEIEMPESGIDVQA